MMTETMYKEARLIVLCNFLDQLILTQDMYDMNNILQDLKDGNTKFALTTIQCLDMQPRVLLQEILKKVGYNIN